MKITSSAVFLICLLYSMNVFSQKQQYSQKDEAALQSLPAKWVRFWNAHTVDSFSTLLKQDADVVTVPGTWLKGSESFIADHRMKFATIFKDSELIADTISIKYLKPDVAVIHFGWGIRGDLDRSGNQQDLRHGIGTWVVTKEEKGWRISSSHMMLKSSARK